LIINGTGGPISYYTSAADAYQLNNPIGNSSAFVGTNGQEIFAAVEDPDYGCITVTSFFLYITTNVINPTTPPDLELCESSYGLGTADFDFTPQVGIAYGTYDPADYTLTFHPTLADATNDTGAISPINNFTGTDGQIIYIRLEDNADNTIFGTAQFTLHVNPLPTASITGTTTICSGDTAQICFVGTPDATVSYTGPSGASTIVLDNTGNACFTTSALTATSTYTLTSVTNTTTTCSQNIAGSAVVTVKQLPTATISGTVSVCQNTPSPVITFTGANGTAPYTFTYTDPAGATQTISTTAGNSVTLPVSTAIAGSFDYTLVSVQSGGTPSCSQNQSGTATVTILELPTATITGTQAVCVGDLAQVVLTGSGGTSPYTFSYTLNSIAQPAVTSTGNSYVINVPTSAPGTFAYSLTNVQSSSTPACSQAQTGTATVTVNDAPVINTPTAYEVCDDNNDGFSCLFNLPSKNSEITLDNTVVITYHETLTDAQTGSNPKSSPYCNINPGTQTLYVRAYYTGSTTCYSTTTLQLIVHPRPLPNPVITDYELCDYNNPGDQEEVFVLNTKDAEIANGQTGVTVTYYLTQTDAENQVSALTNNYTNISNPQEVWINISDNGTGCNSVGSFNLVVNPLPQANLPLPIFECSNGAVTTAEFDLTTNQDVITGGLSGMNVTFYNTLVDAQTPTNAIGTPLTYTGNDNETIYVRVEDTNTGCFSITTQLLRVTQGPTAVTPQPLEYCDPNNDGFGIFNLEDATNEIAGGSLPPGVTVTYHETPTDALLGANPLTSPYVNIDPWTQTIYVKVFYTTTGCSNYVELTLQVHPTPEAVEPADLHLCDYNGAIGYESFDLTQLIPEVLGSMDATQHTVTFYTSETEAQQGTNWISNTAGYTNGVIDQQTIWIRVENNATGCYDVVSVDLIVDPLPNSTQPSYPAYSLCDNDQSSIGYESFDLESKVDDILLGQTGMSVTFYPSLLDAQNNTNAIPNTNLNYINSIQYVQTMGIRITNDATGCYIISTMDIRVEPLPEPVPPTDPYVVCDDNQDGFAPFDLSTLTSDILQGENYLISYHETQTDAEQGNNALPMNYININPFVQYLYVRAEDPDTGCVKVIMIELNVNPSPVAPINLDDITLCDDQDNNTQNGIRLVDLTQRTPDVLSQQPLSPSSYEVTYYTSQLLAEQGTLPITPATAYMGSNGDTIWVRVENLATGCYQLGTFQLVIGIPLQVLTPQPINECDNDSNPNDQHTTFDLTVRTIAPSGYTIKYYPSLAEAHSGTNEILDPTSYINVPPAVQTLGIAIISAEGCKSYTTLNIRVLPVPTPNTTPSTLPALCEEVTGSGQAHVDLTQNATYIINNDPNVVLHYFNSMSDLEANTGEITNPANALVGDASIAGQTINYIQYVYIAVSSTVNSDYTGRPCYVVVPQGYIINPLPVVAQLPNGNIYQECEADPSGINDGITQFNLNGQITNLLVGNQTTPASSYSVAFYEGPGATNMIGNPSNYTNLSNPQTIYVVITNTITGCESAVGQFDLVVNPKPTIAYVMQDFESCDDINANDGMMFYENNPLGLADYIDDLLGPTQLPTDYTVEFYTNQADAEAGNSANAIQNLDTYQVQTGTYWIRIENNITGCYNIDSFNVLIEKLAEPLIESNTGSNIACVNWNTTAVLNNLILDSQVTGNYTFEWYADGVLILGETASTLAITDMALADVTYSVIAVSNSALGCRSAEVSFEVIRSGEAANMSYTVTNAFSDNQIITVTNDGYGIYHYSLDDGPILDNGGVFTNVPFGEHTVYVWDVRDPDGYSCGVAQITGVQVIDYPHYFTPNGDGIHDTWNIVGLGNQPSAKIYIFDRYGKLLKQISSTGDGWDGTFNGALMPSTDYWFLVEYEEQGQIKEFKAHFSLKR
jgi:gliding motility-associated-like protein